ncbi:hypothetical protein Ocin01_14378 [Orchesella cincta]|uniref:Uncharacterized protein n=1 Tax=Orchesella cincta TaxID=48709 RepID=A0A1D2MH88_ORCCI|nr:hypothetical protein Ocin01_14378 [Orchesella cincta]
MEQMDQANIPTSLIDIIEDKGIYAEVGRMYEILLPVARALDHAQSDKCSLADICKQWLELKEALPDDHFTQANFLIERKWECHQSQLLRLCYIPNIKTDYLCLGAGLSKDEFTVGFDLISTFSPVLVGIAASLKSLDSTSKFVNN